MNVRRTAWSGETNSLRTAGCYKNHKMILNVNRILNRFISIAPTYFSSEQMVFIHAYGLMIMLCQFHSVILRGRSYYKTESIRRRFITCVDLHENSIIKHSILFEKYYGVFANSIIKHSRVQKFNYKTSQYFENSIIKQLRARNFNYKTSNCSKTQL